MAGKNYVTRIDKLLDNQQNADSMNPAATDTRTPKHRLLDLLMVAKTSKDLGHYVRRARADDTAWRIIAKNVADITGEDVSPPALIAWFPELTTEDPAA